MSDTYLRAKARELIRAGELPSRLPDRKWGGPGNGAPCMVCGAPVKEDEIGFEVEFEQDGTRASAHHFHVRCLFVLELELAKQKTADTDQMQAAISGRVPDTGAKGARP